MPKLAVLLLLLHAVFCDNVLDVDDILDDRFMPGSLLVLEGTDEYTNSTTKEEEVQNVLDGSFFGAYSTMGFHRQKMNEYLCRSYVADQILTDMSMSRIRRRLGQAISGRDIPTKPQSKTEKPDIKDKLLFDEGSSNYKQWLKKSMTLEDIYRQIKDRETSEIEKESTNDMTSEEFEGEVTGFAVPVKNQNAPDRSGVSKISVSSYGNSAMGMGMSMGNVAMGGHSSFGNSGYDYAHHGVPYVHGGSSMESHGKDKDSILSDLFEIALTAIAFISFGCFVLQVIMCISMATNATTTTAAAMTMMPMMMPTTGASTETLESVIYEPIKISNKVNFDSLRGRKVKRDLEMSSNAAMNELSRRVLLSIEAATVTEQDEGNCLRRKLCEDNRYSRTLSDNQRIWIPVWSFGMSWLSGRLSVKISPATAMLDTLKASILGLGDGNCEILYSNCTLETLKENRKKKK